MPQILVKGLLKFLEIKNIKEILETNVADVLTVSIQYMYTNPPGSL